MNKRNSNAKEILMIVFIWLFALAVFCVVLWKIKILINF